MTHITVTLNPAAFGLPAHPDVPAPTFEFDFDGVDIDEPATEDPLLLHIVYGICNSYPDELHCAPGYRDVVVAYRNARHRSLSVGDTVTLQDRHGARQWTVARRGFEPVAATAS
jgi:hypothetical protein